jgi:hypothetical protein
MASPHWQKLEQDDLWIKCTFEEDSYSILLTDLCQLYTEELDPDELRWRATKAKVPIDIEEAQNLPILLKNLSKSVDDGDVKVSSSTNKSRYMDLVANVHLPKPLPNVPWTFKLELQPDDKFRETVTKPLLTRIDTFQQRQEDLIHRLHDKDHVIDKLLDMLEKHSVDLADGFPSLVSHGTTRRNSNRRQDAEAHIPALQAFNQKSWLNSIERGKRYERTGHVETSRDELEKQLKDGAVGVSNMKITIGIHVLIDFSSKKLPSPARAKASCGHLELTKPTKRLQRPPMPIKTSNNYK